MDVPLTSGYATETCWTNVLLEGYYGPAPTPEPSVTTPVASGGGACQPSDLSGAFVRGGVALGTTHFMFGISSVGADECTLGTPAEVHLEDSAGNDLGITYTTNVVCDGTNAPYCVFQGTIQMLSGQATPAASPEVSGQVSVDIAIVNIANLNPPCVAGTLEAHRLGLVFAGTDGELRIPFPSDVGVQTCRPQVTLFQFG